MGAGNRSIALKIYERRRILYERKHERVGFGTTVDGVEVVEHQDNSSGQLRMYIDQNGEEMKIRYKDTQAFSNVAEVENDFGVYDEYVDDKNTIYYYMHDTEKICLRMEEHEYDTSDNIGLFAMNDEEIKNIADTYIDFELGDDSQLYTFHEVEYQPQKDIYLVTYIRRLGDYITDDSVFVFITSQGEVYAFSAMNRDRYNSFNEGDIMDESLTIALKEVEEGKCELDDIRITMDAETGNLIAITPK